MKIKYLVCSLAVFAAAVPVHAQTHTQNGATLGGVTGAIAGGIIGHQNDETTEGIILGGVLGAVAGGMLGNAKDEQLRRDRYYQNQIRYQSNYHPQPQRPVYVQPQRAASTNDVITMAQSGVSDSVIINHIQTNGIQRRLETHDIITLHQQGVSERVIEAMQRASQGPSASQPSTVVVQKHHYHAPRYVPAPTYYRTRTYHYPSRHYHIRH